jgi:type I restriction enzyme R subunit
MPDALPAYLIDGRLPYGYESTGNETQFTCRMDPEPTARGTFWFHRPETLDGRSRTTSPTAAGRCGHRIPAMPILQHDPGRLRDAQSRRSRTLSGR